MKLIWEIWWLTSILCCTVTHVHCFLTFDVERTWWACKRVRECAPIIFPLPFLIGQRAISACGLTSRILQNLFIALTLKTLGTLKSRYFEYGFWNVLMLWSSTSNNFDKMRRSFDICVNHWWGPILEPVAVIGECGAPALRLLIRIVPRPSCLSSSLGCAVLLWGNSEPRNRLWFLCTSFEVDGNLVDCSNCSTLCISL